MAILCLVMPKYDQDMSMCAKVWPNMDKLWSGMPKYGQIIFNYSLLMQRHELFMFSFTNKRPWSRHRYAKIGPRYM